jgi:hypothetical protein
VKEHVSVDDLSQVRTMVSKLDSRSVLEDVCRFYVRATPHECQEIRNMMIKYEAVRSHLFTCLHKATEMLRSTGDPKWLYIGLAAASIEDSREDPRETYGRLENLYLAAVHSGIDPVPYFTEVAGKSGSKAQSISNESFMHLLANFHQSLYFEKEIRPKLNHLR